LAARPAPRQLQAARRQVRADDLDLTGRVVRPIRAVELQPHDRLLDAQVADVGEHLAREALRGLELQRNRVGHVHDHAVPLQLAARIAHAEVQAHRARGLLEGALEDRHEQLAVAAFDRRACAHVAEHEQALVLGILTAHREEAVDVLGTPHPLEREVAVARQVDARRGLRVEAVELDGLERVLCGR
jgi:hypothetical protein